MYELTKDLNQGSTHIAVERPEVMARRYALEKLVMKAHHNILKKGLRMEGPKLEIEKRLDRIELAIGTMAQWLVQAQTGFSARDAEGIEKILRGESPTKAE